MSLKSRYEIIELSYKDAQKIVVENHYMHRKAPMSVAFGLFDHLTRNVVGAALYGTPSSSTLRIGLAGKENAKHVVELTRLWLAPYLPRNAASYLVGNTVRRSGKPFVVSYADTSVGHVGYVYQATNWLYTGLSAKRTEWKIEGYDGHSQTLSDKYKVSELREMYGDKFRLIPRPRKHRYVFVNARGKRRQRLIEQLRYPLLPYPKGETRHAEEPSDWFVLYLEEGAA